MTERTYQSGRPAPEHEALARALHGLMHRTAEEHAPVLGTVKGHDGGKVKVHLDDEANTRSTGNPRVRGQRHQEGQRVLVHRVKGDIVVGETVSSKEGPDPAVDTPDMFPDSVDSATLAPGVRQDISTAKSDASKAIGDAKDAMDEAKAKADKDHNHSNYVSNNDLDNYATKDWVNDQLKDYQKK